MRRRDGRPTGHGSPTVQFRGVCLWVQSTAVAEHLCTRSQGLENTTQRDMAMTNGLRWRILVLQVGLIGILAFVSGFAFWASNFATSTVHDQLAAQQIYFPTAGSAALTALPRTDDTAMTQYAGQQLLTGQQAEVYANNFINVHLGEIGGGKTYSQLSAAAMAAPTNAKLAAQVETIFKGTTLRSMLLNAYGWSQIGLFAGYAAIGLLVAAIVVLGAFLFEIVRWRATVTATRTTTVRQTAVRQHA
jgi:hypothetical protein